MSLLRDLATNHGVTVLLAEHRFESILDSVDSIVVINSDGTASKGSTPWQPERDDLRDRAESRRSSRPGAVLLSVEDLSVKFGDQIAVDRANLSVKSGEILALRGPNGSGKSSLLWAIQGSGTREKTSSVQLTDIGDPRKTSPNQRLRSITMVPQRAADLLFLTSLGQELEESDRFANAAGTTTGNIFARLAGKVNPGLHPRDLSSGQQLALVLAIQLAKGAPVILLDEPTRGLDYLAKRNLANHLKALAADGKAVLLATHDDEFIRQTATRVIEIEAGVLL
jgi:energy-coupling factor transport system ATP-binding protein